MKPAMNLLGIVVLIFCQIVLFNIQVSADEQGYRHFYGVAGEPAGDVKYARQMGYDYIAVNPSFPPENYHKNPGCAGLKFYLVDPQWHPQVLSGYSRTIDTAQPVSNEAKEFYNLTMVWKSNDPFPYNLATGYNPAGDPAKISVMWDFQQQAVINEAVEKIVSLVKSYEDHGLSFTFGGYIINEPKLSGGFYRLDEEGDNIPVGLSYWTWADSGLVHGTITHEYATYSEGMAAFYKKLRSRLAREFEDAKWIVQPTELYSESNNNEWIYQIKDRADKDELTPDMLSQGSWQHTNFVDDVHNFSSGVNITKDRVGNSQAGDAEEYRNRLFAAKAGMNGAWYNWFGQFGGRGGMPDFQDIPDIYPRMKLIRCLPNWDNLNKVPLTERSWDGNIYQSITSYASGDIMYSRHPKTGKLFAVFLTLSGALTLNAGETVASAQRTDGYFIESGDGIADVSIVGNEIRLKSKANLGKGYIFTVASDGYQYTDGQMTAVTGSETDETSGFVASEITGNTNESSDTMLVEFASYQEEEEQNISAQTATSQQLRTASTWQPVVKRTQAQKRAGLSGGEGWQMITGISYAPSNPNIVYFITDTNQVWKSTNGGTSWHRKSGYPANGGASIVVHPTNPNIVYAAASVMGTWTLPEGSIEGIMRSTDGGDTWMLLYEAPFTRGYHWGNHIVFAGSNMYAAPDQHGILKSTNGTTWSRLNRSGGGYILSDKRLQNITVHPTDNTILFVSAHDGLYRVVDNGSSATQTKIGSGLPGGAVYQLQINPSNPNIMYVTAGTKGVYRSTDGGLNFSSRNNGLSTALNGTGTAMYLVMAPGNPNRLFVTFQYIFGRHLYYTNDGGANWTQTTTMDYSNADGWVKGSLFGWTHNIFGVMNTGAPMAFHPSNQNIALVSGFGDIVCKTTDGGVTWSYSNTGYTGSVTGQMRGSSPIAWDPLDSNRAAFSHSDFGTLLTENHEDTFKNIANVWYNNRQATSTIAMRGNIIVKNLGQTNGKTDDHIIAISRNAGSAWTTIEAAKGALLFSAFHPTNANIVYIGQYRFNDIRNNNNYTKLSRSVYGMFKGNGNIVYSFSGSTIYKSTDAGASWTTPYPSLNLPAGNEIFQIDIDPVDENRIYAAVREVGVYIITNTTANGGQVLLRNQNHGLELDQFGKVNTQAVKVDPNNPDVVYAGNYAAWTGMSNGVFRSTDKGLTWTNINGNIGKYININSISINPFNSYVYIGSFAGTWKLPPPTSTSISGTVPKVTTGSASGVTTNAATLNGTVNANGLTTTVWFEYGTASGSYGSKSSTHSVSGTGDTAISIGVNGLSGGQTYYYRIVSQNSAGTSYGSERSFTTSTTVTDTPDGLLAYYRFDEGAGTSAADASGNGNNGTLFNGPVWTTGKINSALSFDGVNDYVEVPNSASINPVNFVTVSAWIYPTAPGQSNDSKIIVKRHQTLANDNYSLGFTSGSRPEARIVIGGSMKSIYGPVLSLNAWHHLVGVYNGSTLKLYVNGTEVNSIAASGSLDTSTYPLRIGTRAVDPVNRYFKGSIDEVRVYNRALSEQEVQSLYGK